LLGRPGVRSCARLKDIVVASRSVPLEIAGRVPGQLVEFEVIVGVGRRV
jgi:hypothetical protein